MATVALVLHVASERGTGTAVGALLLAEAVPRLAGPVAGAICDRVDQRRLLLACEAGQGAVVAATALWLPALPGLVLLVALRSLLFTAVQPAGRSIVPDLVERADLAPANALLGAAPEIGAAAGPILAGLLFEPIGAAGILGLDAVTFALALPLLARLPPLPPEPGERAGVVSETRAGLRLVARDPVLRPLAAGFVVLVLALGLDDLVLAFLGRDTFGAGGAGTGVLYAAPACGLLLGYGLVTGRAVGAAPLVAVMAGFGLASAGNLATGLAPVLAVAVATQVVRGVGNSLIDVGLCTVVQTSVPRAARGRVFGVVFGAVEIAVGVSYAAGGPLLDATSPRAVLVGAGAAGLAVTAVVAARLAGRYGAAHGRGRAHPADQP
jgi:MFS family permease